MKVRGQDDLARLATSMNYMASELEKQINTLEELSAVQQRFVSDVSHELRTPLTTVRMAAEVLHEARDDFDPVAARSAELLQKSLTASRRCSLTYLRSRASMRGRQCSTSRSRSADLVHRVVEANAPLAETYHTEITVHERGDAKAEVEPRGLSESCMISWSTRSSTVRVIRSTSSLKAMTRRSRSRFATMA